MKIEIEVPEDRVAQLWASAIEGGDPVTTASRGGWCSGIDLEAGHPMPLPAYWYTSPEFVADGVEIIVVEVDDEETGHETRHTVRLADWQRGLTVMAQKFPSQFAQVLDDNIDAPCADAFLQSMLFGEEKYA